MILSNYTAAFLGNRQIANSNTKSIFENRNSILSNTKTDNEVEKNYIEAQKNKASIDFLKHKSELNSAALKISEEMAEINLKLVGINRKVMELNQLIVDFNSDQISTNNDLLNGGLQPTKATPEKVPAVTIPTILTFPSGSIRSLSELFVPKVRVLSAGEWTDAPAPTVTVPFPATPTCRLAIYQ